MLRAGMEVIMSKIICDVCGTAYPENAAQCPICGCAKPCDANLAVSDTASDEGAGGSYTYVKGGRFSKANVKKRNKGGSNAVRKASRQDAPVPVDNGGDKSNKGLIITAVVLLLAIIAVVIYIGVRFFLPLPGEKEDKKPTEPVSTTVPVTTLAPVQIGCTEVKLADTTIELTTPGQAWLLNVTTVPADTTDEIQYVSSDPSVVTVNAEGRLSAVASGQATVTVTCGSAKAECVVLCSLDTAAAATNGSEPASSAPADENDGVDPNKNYTVYFYGETREDNDVTLSTGDIVEVTLEDEDGNEAKVTWQTEDTGIVDIDGTTFTAIGSGTAKITTKIGSKTYTIIFRVY